MADTTMDKWNEIPPYLIGFVHDDQYDEEEEPEDDPYAETEGESDTILLAGPDVEGEEDNYDLDAGETDDDDITLFPPDSMVIVQQIVRLGADGRSVVDVILEVEDVPGKVQYDVRVTKV